MKRLSLLTVLMLTICLLPTMVFAQYDDTLRYGMNFSASMSTQNLSAYGRTSSDTQLTYSPSFYASKGRYYGNATLTKGASDYTFDLGSNIRATGKHSSFDGEVGYLITDILAVHGGWRSMNIDLTYTNAGAPLGSGMLHSYGPVLGLRASQTVGQSALLVGGDVSVMSMTLSTESPAGNTKDTNAGYSLSATASYPMGKTTLSAGYSYQVIMSDKTADSVSKGFSFNYGVRF